MSAESWEGESQAIVRRIFGAAAARVGGEAALARHLGINLSELRTYLAGDVMPPEDVLLRAVDLVLDELGAIKRQFSERAWLGLSLPAAPGAS